MKRSRIKAVASVPIRRKATLEAAKTETSQAEAVNEIPNQSSSTEVKTPEDDVQKVAEQKPATSVVEPVSIRNSANHEPAKAVTEAAPVEKELPKTAREVVSRQEPAEQKPTENIVEAVCVQEPIKQELSELIPEPVVVYDLVEVKPVESVDVLSSTQVSNPDLSTLETEEYTELQSCGQSIASNEVFSDLQLVNDIEIGISEDLEILSSEVQLPHEDGHRTESESELEQSIPTPKLNSLIKSSVPTREGSPIKMRNRSCFMRPSPRLDGGGRIRRNSVQSSGASASESEDDSRRSNSVASNRNSKDNVSSNAAKLNINQKRKMVVSEAARKISSAEASVQEKKVSMARARREFLIKHDNKPPDKSKLTMYDLIYYNPITNPMKVKPVSSAPRKISISKTQVENDKDEDEPVEESSEMLVPQVKVGPNGQLIIDEQSLVIDQYKAQENIDRSDIVVDDENTGGGFYKKRPKSKDWNKWETIKFYKALNTYGTDFLLMGSVFPQRTRQELKLKYKKEERNNPNLIEKALLYQQFDTEALDKDLENLDESIRKESKAGKTRKVSASKRKRKRCTVLHDEVVDEDDEDAEETLESDSNEEITVKKSKPRKVKDKQKPPTKKRKRRRSKKKNVEESEEATK